MSTDKKLGRNDPCSCGSGKKAKACCGTGRRATASPVANVAPLASQLLRAGRHAEAIGALIEGLRVTPNDAGLWNDLGTAYLIVQRLEDAVRSLSRSLALRPNFADTHFNLGLALEQAGYRDSALSSYRKAIALAPKMPEPHARIAELLLQQGSTAESKVAYEDAARALPGTTLGELSAVKALLIDGRSVDAEARLAKLVARDPSASEAHVLLGIVQSEAGKFDVAAASFEACLALAPTSATAHHGLVTTKRLTETDRPIVDRVVDLLKTERLPEAIRATLNFAAGKGLDDLADYAGAMAHFDAANALRRRLARPFNAADFANRMGQLIARFTPEFFAEHAAVGSQDQTPILVLGMPRSGTTLVERILASHPKVRGGGELTFWNGHAPALVDATVETITKRAGDVQKAYLSVLGGIGDTPRVTDKMPFNFLWVGVIHLLFPKARIVHCRRNAIDTCLSIYTTLFAQHWGFASDRGDLVAYYQQYERLMNHWRATLPEERFLDVDYEAVTDDPEANARRLVAFAGLEWDDACLRPEGSHGPVKTASKWQARQPIFKTSVERWRRYEPWLGALADLKS